MWRFEPATSQLLSQPSNLKPSLLFCPESDSAPDPIKHQDISADTGNCVGNGIDCNPAGGSLHSQLDQVQCQPDFVPKNYYSLEEQDCQYYYLIFSGSSS